MRTQRTIPILALLLLVGCATVQTGSDPVVVNAEKVTSSALETFNTAFKVEAELRKAGKVSDSINNYFNAARVNSPKWIDTAEAETLAYKNNRDSAHRVSLQTAIAVITTSIAQLQKYLSQIQG